MKPTKAFFPSIVGTTAMTIFSYAVSGSREENFKEPKLLAELTSDFFAKEYKYIAKPGGWGMHYAMGLAMATVFQELWKQRKRKPNVKDSAYAGLISGLTGILIWQTLFKVSANSPKVPIKHYYSHLILAHLIFSAGVALTSRLVSPFKKYR